MNLASYVDKTTPNDCNSPQAHVYIQYYCGISEAEQQNIKHKAIGVILICTIVCILYLLTIFYLRATTNLELKEWDV